MKKNSSAENIGIVELTFAGDMFFDIYFQKVFENTARKELLANIRKIVSDTDLFIVNLENPKFQLYRKVASHLNGHNESDDPSNISRFMVQSRINLVNLGNNHTMNLRDNDLLDTKRMLQNFNISYFGDPTNLSDFRTEVNGVKVAIISFNAFGEDVDDSVAQIELAVKSGYLPIVYAHWGKRFERSQPELRAIARKFIDAGAEMVVGSHPHVIGEEEIYSGKPIFYSLGDFLCRGASENAGRRGLLLNVSLGEKGVLFWKRIPVEMEEGGKVTILDPVALSNKLVEI